MAEPAWLTEARKHIGLREIPGAQTAPTIARWLAGLGAWWRDDETPWCGVAVAAWMQAAGHKPPAAWYRAKAWATWGEAAPQCLGAVAVLERKGGGHVGLLVGMTPAGWPLILGGNQGDAVSVASFDPARIIAYRMPAGWRKSGQPVNVAPLITAVVPASRSEA